MTPLRQEDYQALAEENRQLRAELAKHKQNLQSPIFMVAFLFSVIGFVTIYLFAIDAVVKVVRWAVAP